MSANLTPDAFDSDRRAVVLERVAATLNHEMSSVLGLDDAIEVLGMDDDGAVQVRLNAICQSCPASAMGLVLGLEDIVRKQAPEVRYLEVVP